MTNSCECQALAYEQTRFLPEVGFGSAQPRALDVGVKIGFTDHTKLIVLEKAIPYTDRTSHGFGGLRVSVMGGGG